MPVPAEFRGEPEHILTVADVPWWRVFQNKHLNELIREAYLNNRDLAVMAANVEKARQYASVADAALFPWVNYGGGISKGENSSGGTPAYTGGTAASGSGRIGVSWELDIWGKYRRMAESATAEYFASSEAQRALMLSILSQVANTYLTLLQLDEQLEIRQESVASYGESLELFRQRLAGKVGSMQEVATAEAPYAAAQAAIHSLEAQIATYENLLSALLGRTPGHIDRSGSLREMAAKAQVPAGIPAQVLGRRPDVRQQMFMMRSANAKIGVAISNFFPSISLTSSWGRVSPDLTQTLGSKANSWGVAANLAGPIFEGGTLLAQKRAAEADFRATKATYEKTVLNALAEVANALAVRNKYNEVIEAQDRAIAANRTAVQVSKDLFKGGLTNYLDVIYAQQNLFPAQLQQTQYLYQRASSLVSLYVALGGGWSLTHDQMSGIPSTATKTKKR